MNKTQRLELIKKIHAKRHSIVNFEPIAPSEEDLEEEESFFRVERGNQEFELELFQNIVFGS
jgi:hypothetical protein